MEQFSQENFLVQKGRELQPPQIPDSSSLPTEIALQVTPEAFKSNETIDAARAADAAGKCTFDGNRCHIPFVPPTTTFDSSNTNIGVVIYPGAFVDPRGYSPLAHRLATRYGLPTVILIFKDDFPVVFGKCDSGRIDLAKAEFPIVEKWILAGHSLGGVAASVDMMARLENMDDSVSGLAMLASDPGVVGCGVPDFSRTNLPMASVTGTVDGVHNLTRWEMNKKLLSSETIFVEIFGGNHGQFGSYDDSGRSDGTSLIPPEIQWDLTVAAIAHVASRTGDDLPMRNENENADDCMSTSSANSGIMGSNHNFSWAWMILLLLVWLVKSK